MESICTPERADPRAIERPAIISPYLTAEEAAAYLRTTVQGVYSLVKRRKIKPMAGRPGRLLFPRGELDRYLGGKFRR
jgi:excisionase family DNA binding protein